MIFNLNRVMKTKEEIIKRRKQFPRVFVSYNGVTWVRRILLLENIDGTCFTVSENWEKEFLNGENFCISSWFYHKPVPEIKQVPFSHGREIDWNWVFRRKIIPTDLLCISAIYEGFIKFHDEETAKSFHTIAELFELSKDGGKTWVYAGKEVEE